MNLNARSFIFIFAMTSLFFGLTWYFDKGKPKTDQPQVEVVTDEFSDRRASINDLPLSRLYLDPAGKEFATLAVDDQGHFITTSWTKDLPNELYALQGRGALVPVQLNTQEKNAVLYSQSKSMKMPVVTVDHYSDVQVIDMRDGKVYLGEYNGGQISFPADKPSGDAIVLYKSGSQYLPMGTFDDGTFTSFTELTSFNVATVSPAKPQIQRSRAEQLYVLENAYQQVVFSSIGGAISEINLPFKDSDDEQSIVLPINFDREIEKDSPGNALFPMQSAHGAGGSEVQPKKGGYYPLLRRGINNASGSPKIEVPPRYYATNIVGETPEAAKANFSMSSIGKDFIEFQGTIASARVTKRYSFSKAIETAPYCLDLQVTIDGDASGLWLTSGVPDVEIISNRAAPVLKYRATVGERTSVDKVKMPKQAVTYSDVRPDWICNSNGYFGVIIDPLQGKPESFQASLVPGILDPTRLTTVDGGHKLYPADKYPGYEMLVPLKTGTQTYRLYAGPFQRNLLGRLDKVFSVPATGYNPDYEAAWSFHGWFAFISEPFAKFLFLLMQGFHALTGSWGLSIILLTVALRLMLYPLNAWSIKSTMRMQKLQPKIAEIQARVKKGDKKAQLEMMAVYREHKVNPFTGGCLPMLIQMPFLIGMFDLLKSAFDLRGAPFIPGWINNLAAPDVLFSWNTPIPFFGTSFHLLPFLLGGVMYFNQKMMMKRKATPGEELDDKAKQAKMMGNVMAIVFTFIFYKFPSGLNLYWLSSMLLGMVQQKWMMNKQPPTPDVEVQPKPTSGLKKRRH